MEDDTRFKDCLDACQACADACDRCAAACLGEDDVRMMARCIALDVDCAHLCRAAAGILARAGEAAEIVCAACAAVCELCAGECGQHRMEHCQQCAAACRACADACRAMLGTGDAS